MLLLIQLFILFEFSDDMHLRRSVTTFHSVLILLQPCYTTTLRRGWKKDDAIMGGYN